MADDDCPGGPLDDAGSGARSPSPSTRAAETPRSSVPTSQPATPRVTLGRRSSQFSASTVSLGSDMTRDGSALVAERFARVRDQGRRHSVVNPQNPALGLSASQITVPYAVPTDTPDLRLSKRRIAFRDRDKASSDDSDEDRASQASSDAHFRAMKASLQLSSADWGKSSAPDIALPEKERVRPPPRVEKATTPIKPASGSKWSLLKSATARTTAHEHAHLKLQTLVTSVAAFTAASTRAHTRHEEALRKFVEGPKLNRSASSRVFGEARELPTLLPSCPARPVTDSPRTASAGLFNASVGSAGPLPRMPKDFPPRPPLLSREQRPAASLNDLYMCWSPSGKRARPVPIERSGSGSSVQGEQGLSRNSSSVSLPAPPAAPSSADAPRFPWDPPPPPPTPRKISLRQAVAESVAAAALARSAPLPTTEAPSAVPDRVREAGSQSSISPVRRTLSFKLIENAQAQFTSPTSQPPPSSPGPATASPRAPHASPTPRAQLASPLISSPPRAPLASPQPVSPRVPASPHPGTASPRLVHASPLAPSSPQASRRPSVSRSPLSSARGSPSPSPGAFDPVPPPQRPRKGSIATTRAPPPRPALVRRAASSWQVTKNTPLQKNNSSSLPDVSIPAAATGSIEARRTQRRTDASRVLSLKAVVETLVGIPDGSASPSLAADVFEDWIERARRENKKRVIGRLKAGDLPTPFLTSFIKHHVQHVNAAKIRRRAKEKKKNDARRAMQRYRASVQKRRKEALETRQREQEAMVLLGHGPHSAVSAVATADLARLHARVRQMRTAVFLELQGLFNIWNMETKRREHAARDAAAMDQFIADKVERVTTLREVTVNVYRFEQASVLAAATAAVPVPPSVGAPSVEGLVV